jgi:lipid II:glycine glycyltransferase (peptidoglycan interpeptide bridge formation enzyme)
VQALGEKLEQVKAANYHQLLQVYRNLHPRGASVVLGAYNKEHQLIGGILFFRYKTTTIYYFGGTAEAYRNSGAMALIIWESIQKWHGISRIYDFDGSMIEGIERFLRSFGAVPVPYYRVRKRRFPFTLLSSRSD